MPPPDGTIALEVLAMSDKDEVDRLINWESRPAIVLASGLTYAITSRGGGWVEVNRSEVIDSGRPISAETFSKTFPNLVDASTSSRTSPEK